MAYSYRDLICPKCRKTYGFQFVNVMLIEVGSGLGPPLVRCTSCGAVFDSGLTEWLRMSNTQRTRYVLLSIFYSVVEGMILSSLPFAIIGRVFYPCNNQFVSTPVFLLGVLVCSVPVLGFQLFRVVLSDSRVKNNIRRPMDVSVWTWQTNPQGWWLAISVIVLAVSFFIFRFHVNCYD